MRCRSWNLFPPAMLMPRRLVPPRMMLMPSATLVPMRSPLLASSPQRKRRRCKVSRLRLSQIPLPWIPFGRLTLNLVRWLMRIRWHQLSNLPLGTNRNQPQHNLKETTPQSSRLCLNFLALLRRLQSCLRMPTNSPKNCTPVSGFSADEAIIMLRRNAKLACGGLRLQRLQASSPVRSVSSKVEKLTSKSRRLKVKSTMYN
mmetsp:Transcript_7178/g.12244  ORF Transcript_7178/g.12244 Transcript_7178/m.12244 type:complete len:201 (-) Transcript_7178:279-881(-)